VKKTTRITIETERLLVIRHGMPARFWCEQCATEVDMVLMQSAAELAQVGVRKMQRLPSDEQFHGARGGAIRICLNWLLKSLSRPLKGRTL
jgi:hypothetical protein